MQLERMHKDYKECKLAVIKMKYNKSSGLEGLTYEIYQAVSPLLGIF